MRKNFHKQVLRLAEFLWAHKQRFRLAIAHKDYSAFRINLFFYQIMLQSTHNA